MSIIQRDLIKLLAYLDSGQLENKHAGRVVVLMFAVASVAYLEGVRRDKLIELFAEIIRDFDPELYAEELQR
jgi:hypothetical protein